MADTLPVGYTAKLLLANRRSVIFRGVSLFLPFFRRPCCPSLIGFTSFLFRQVRDADDKPVIIKALAARPTAQQIFSFEQQYWIAKSLEGVNHVVSALGIEPFGSNNESLCMIMEDCGGVSLRELISNVDG